MRNQARWLDTRTFRSFLPFGRGCASREANSAFFAEVVRLAGEADGRRIVYVGERLDNDVIPAAQAGMFGVFLKRGPWAYLQASQPDAARAEAEIDSLGDLPALLCADRGDGPAGKT